MELLNQTHYEDIRRVIHRPEWTDYNYQAELHPNRSGSEKMERVESIDWSCDYVNNFTAHISVMLMCSADVYYKKIFPYRNNMEITLTLFVAEPCSLRTIETPRRYRCIFDESTGRHMDQEVLHSMETQAMNISEYHTFHVQCVELFVETTPFVNTEGLYINEDREEFMRGTISHALDTVTSKAKYDYLYIDPMWENKNKIERALLSTHTPAIDIPHIVQKDFGGFYNHGLGSFHHYWGGTHYRHNVIPKFNQWMIYPYMDVSRWHRVTNNNKLHMWVVPDTNKAWDNYHHTYHFYPPRLEEKCGPWHDLVMSIYVRRTKAASEAAESRSPVKPYGVHTTYPKEFMDVPVDVSATGVYGSGDRLNKDFQFHTRNDGLDQYTDHYKADTVNYSVNSTKMKENMGKRMDFIWTHSYHEILMPGMPVRMHWEEDRRTKVTYGILIHAHSLILNMGKVNTESGRFDTKSYLTVYVERPPHEL